MKTDDKNDFKKPPLFKHKAKTLVGSLFVYLIFVSILFPNKASAQTTSQVDSSISRVSIGVRAGYDHPLFSMPFQELTYKGHRNIGGHLDFRVAAGFGIRAEYANILTQPDIRIPGTVNYHDNAVTTSQHTLNLTRHFVGIGPSYRINFGASRFSILASPLAGYSWLSGGDALVEAENPAGGTDILLLNTGFQEGVFSAKGDLDFEFEFTKNLRMNLGLYYMRHFGVHFDNAVDVNNVGPATIVHGENVFDQTPTPYTISTTPPNIVTNPACKDLSSVGATLGLTYTFGKLHLSRVFSRESKDKCTACECPNDKHKVVVTVRDQLSRKVIPDADVAIKDIDNNIVSTGTTNSFGVVDFGEIPHGTYAVTGKVYGVETTIASISKNEFFPNSIIQKEILYTDLRFILKGRTINKKTKYAEPNVVVSLTRDTDRNVKQDNSNGNGEFVFRLDKNSSYEIVGTKSNRLSEIERASTIGLTRSTTLFVDLELGMDNLDCGKGTILDIKYEFDKWDLTTASKFELDRIVRYLRDHQGARIELSSHTDSRGTQVYNLDLSEKRARSAADYIVSKGIARSRIVNQGYGETQLLNRCRDDANCTEEEHRMNRRTEAKLLCN